MNPEHIYDTAGPIKKIIANIFALVSLPVVITATLCILVMMLFREKRH